MDIDVEDFRSHFELLSDATLLATKREDLVPAAQGVYDQELAKRSLNSRAAASADFEDDVSGEDAVEAEAPATEPLAMAGEYTILDEARLARGLLQGAGIPCGLTTDAENLGLLRLMVPESYLEGALEVLAGEISEEELAAQAEAAGLPHEEQDQDRRE